MLFKDWKKCCIIPDTSNSNNRSTKNCGTVKPMKAGPFKPNQQHKNHSRKRSTSRSSSSSDDSTISVQNSKKCFANKWTHRLAIFCTAILCFAHSFDGHFVFDDEEAIVHNKDVTQINPIINLWTNDFWGTPITSNLSHKSYRPLTTLTFRLNHLVHGLDVGGYHAVNILLHAVVSVLVYELYQRVLQNTSSSIAFFGSLLFALHPVHTECVANVVGRAELLGGVWFLCSLLSYDHYLREDRSRWLVATVLAAAASMLSKEQGITVLAVCMAYDAVLYLRISPRKLYEDRMNLKDDIVNNNIQKAKFSKMFQVLRRWSCLIFSTVFLLSFRMAIMAFTTPNFSPPDNPASFLPSFILRSVNYMYLYCLNLWLLLNPSDLCFDYSMGCVPLIQTVSDPRVLLAAAFIVVSSGLIYKLCCVSISERLRICYFGLSLMVITFLPCSNLFLRVGFVLAERVLYLPSIGFCLLLAVAIDETFRKSNQKHAIFGFIMLLYFLKSGHRTGDWRSEQSLYSSGLRVCPHNAKVHYNLAKVLSDTGHVTLAQNEYREALRLRPDYEQAMNNLANLLKDHGGFTEAEQLLVDAVRLKPTFAAAWMNLGIVRSNLHKYSQAEDAYWRALHLRTPYADCWFNLGNLYLQQGRQSEAYSAWNNATFQKPTHAKAWINQMVMLDSEGRCDQAVVVGERALMYNGGHAGIHFTLGGCYGKLGSMKHAETHLTKAIQAEPQNANYYANLGVLYHRWEKYDKAKSLYRKALNIDPGLTLVRDNMKMLQ